MSCTTCFYKKLEPQPTREEVLKYFISHCDEQIEFWQKFLTKPINFSLLVAYKWNYDHARESIDLWNEVKRRIISGELTEETEYDANDPVTAYSPSYYIVSKSPKKEDSSNRMVDFTLSWIKGDMDDCLDIIQYDWFKDYNIDVADVAVGFARLFIEYHRILNGGELTDEQKARCSKIGIIYRKSTLKRNGFYYVEIENRFYNCFRVHDFPDDTLTSYDEAIAFIERYGKDCWTDENTNGTIKQFFDEYNDGIIVFL